MQDKLLQSYNVARRLTSDENDEEKTLLDAKDTFHLTRHVDKKSLRSPTPVEISLQVAYFCNKFQNVRSDNVFISQIGKNDVISEPKSDDQQFPFLRYMT